jgi:hypothetical protein
MKCGQSSKSNCSVVSSFIETINFVQTAQTNLTITNTYTNITSAQLIQGEKYFSDSKLKRPGHRQAVNLVHLAYLRSSLSPANLAIYVSTEGDSEVQKSNPTARIRSRLWAFHPRL